MADKIDNKIIYNADDEEPQCQKCDNFEMPDTFCMNNCGGGYGWNGYQRTEIK